MADKPRRAVGWVGRLSDSPANTNISITFAASFSETARLEVTVLRSYENFLDAYVTVSDCDTLDDVAGDEPHVRGSWDKRLSIPDTTAWDAGAVTLKNPAGGFSERRFACLPKPGVVRNVTITVRHPMFASPPRALRPGDKVKILSVVSC